MIEGFDEVGFDVFVNSQDDNIVELAYEFEDVCWMVFYLDKVQQCICVWVYYDVEGQLEILFEYVFEFGELVVFIVYCFVIFYDVLWNGV